MARYRTVGCGNRLPLPTMAPSKSSLVVACCWLAAAAVACLDISELPYHATTHHAPGAMDGAGNEMTASQKCVACLDAPEVPGPGCGTPRQACAANAICDAIIACGIENECFGIRGTNDRVSCFIPCSLGQGVATYDHPAILLIAPYFDCGLPGGPCADACQYEAF
jgi:hypothetical protein